MEFFQFHPTALRLPGAPPFLISEAVRGEGGVLLDAGGRRFMERYDVDGELAARDVVARAMVAEMRASGADNVLLDVRHLDPRTVTSRFPSIYQFCLQYGLDITKEPIPVAPAAHYMMGGLRVTPDGRTNVPGLLAAGETACTGAHGANRLASNSLLETLVFARRMVDEALGAARSAVEEPPVRREERRVLPAREIDPRAYPVPSLEALQALMWDHVGIERDADGLTHAVNTLTAWGAALPEPGDRPGYDLRNAIVTARLVAESALAREESRGAHTRTDFPQTSRAWERRLVYTG